MRGDESKKYVAPFLWLYMVKFLLKINGGRFVFFGVFGDEVQVCGVWRTDISLWSAVRVF